jgi:peroxiredoxin
MAAVLKDPDGPTNRGTLVEEGSPAPDFPLRSDSGERVSLSQFRGQPVVLYFYPKDAPASNCSNA